MSPRPVLPPFLAFPPFLASISRSTQSTLFLPFCSRPARSSFPASDKAKFVKTRKGQRERGGMLLTIWKDPSDMFGASAISRSHSKVFLSPQVVCMLPKHSTKPPWLTSMSFHIWGASSCKQPFTTSTHIATTNTNTEVEKSMSKQFPQNIWLEVWWPASAVARQAVTLLPLWDKLGDALIRSPPSLLLRPTLKRFSKLVYSERWEKLSTERRLGCIRSRRLRPTLERLPLDLLSFPPKETRGLKTYVLCAF